MSWAHPLQKPAAVTGGVFPSLSLGLEDSTQSAHQEAAISSACSPGQNVAARKTCLYAGAF